MAVSRVEFVAARVALAAFLVCAGIIIGYFSTSTPKQMTLRDVAGDTCKGDQDDNREYINFKKLIKEANGSIADRITDEINKTEIKKTLRKLLSQQPPVAGTQAELERAHYIREKWLKYGIDEVNILPYDVLLSYPGDVKKNPNILQILEEDGTVVHEATLNEPILDRRKDKHDILPPWLAYTPGGEVEGELVYANRGSLEDFKLLTDVLGINVTDRIVIARYGDIYRGNKIKHAQLYGAKGVILFSDPGDVTEEGAGVYPDSEYLPEYGMQRGTTKSGYGDPLTPGYPAIDITQRISIADAENSTRLPRIPAQQIGYADAKKFFESIDPSSQEAPVTWRGKINTTYRLGPKMVNNRVVRLVSRNTRETRTTHNVIGIIRGCIEPDRYVMVGGHHDAWVSGAFDNTQGTALLLELARVFGKLLFCGWRPRRSIILASWGAEEYGLIGANEFVEEFSKNLAERAVAYINTDVSVIGRKFFFTLSSPLLNSVIYRATEFIKSPDAEYNTLREFWSSREKHVLNNSNDEPVIFKLGARSDHAPFYNIIGVPSMNSGRFGNDTSSYPLYHSAYETFRAVKMFIDPTFEYQQAIARLVGEMVRLLAEELVLPMDVRYYAKDITTTFAQIKKRFGTKLDSENITLSKFEEAVESFANATELFNIMAENVDRHDPIAVRMLNDKMMLLERAFIDPLGLPGRPLYRHIVAAPSRSNACNSVGFPGVVDAIADTEDLAVDDKVNGWRLVRKEIAKAIFALKSAGSTLLGHVKLGR
ncbi:unnamed protein product [Owenia fusiformis]|uniref:Aminopeptidase NAALADL1 n=1 Tax=Owenia fusiformis TaxID=6347 RepID=A0A8J1XUH7_OWEFU|nr:unnamed protein product [Owenia fusiformis]